MKAHTTTRGALVYTEIREYLVNGDIIRKLLRIPKLIEH